MQSCNSVCIYTHQEGMLGNENFPPAGGSPDPGSTAGKFPPAGGSPGSTLGILKQNILLILVCKAC